MTAFSLDFLSGDNAKAFLAIFCFYDYSANASEAVEKIATDEKDYHKCSMCMIVSNMMWQTLNNINKSKKDRLPGCIRRS